MSEISSNTIKFGPSTLIINYNPKIDFLAKKIYPLPISMASIIWFKEDAPIHINAFIDSLKNHGILSLIIDEKEDKSITKFKFQKSDFIIVPRSADEYYYTLKPYIGIKPIISFESIYNIIYKGE